MSSRSENQSAPIWSDRSARPVRSYAGLGIVIPHTVYSERLESSAMVLFRWVMVLVTTTCASVYISNGEHQSLAANTVQHCLAHTTTHTRLPHFRKHRFNRSTFPLLSLSPPLSIMRKGSTANLTYHSTVERPPQTPEYTKERTGFASTQHCSTGLVDIYTRVLLGRTLFSSFTCCSFNLYRSE